MKGILLLALVAGIGLPSWVAEAQTSGRQTVTQFTEWFATTSTIKVSPLFSIFVDGQYRFVKEFDPGQFMFRIGGDFRAGKNFYVTPLGYAHIWNRQYGEQPVAIVNNEHRIYQQFQLNHRASALLFQHRLRTEERFIQQHHNDASVALVDDGYINRQFRVRYRLLFNIPLTHQQDPGVMAFDAKTVYVQIFDELFMSWGERVTYHQPDQNRLFAGLGYQLNTRFSIQSGFYWQILIKSNGALQENNVGIAMWLNYNFDLTD